MSRKQIIIAAVAAIVLVVAGVGAYFYFADSDENPVPEETAAGAAPQNVPSGPVPDPVMLVVDKAFIMQASKAGQDIGRQVQARAQAIRAELEPQARALRGEEQQLRSQMSSLSVEERQRRVASIEGRERAFQQGAQQKEAQIKQAVGVAQKQLSAKMGPILGQIMKERKANLIVDKQAVVFGTDSTLDVSQEAVKRLDQQLPAVPVQFAQ